MNTATEQSQEQNGTFVGLELRANQHFRSIRWKLSPKLGVKVERTLLHLFSLRVLLQDFMIVSSRITCQKCIDMALQALLDGDYQLCMQHAEAAEKWYQYLHQECVRFQTR